MSEINVNEAVRVGGSNTFVIEHPLRHDFVYKYASIDFVARLVKDTAS